MDPGFAIGAIRKPATWRAAAAIAPEAWTAADGMPGAQVAVCDYAPAGWPPGTRCLPHVVDLPTQGQGELLGRDGLAAPGTRIGRDRTRLVTHPTHPGLVTLGLAYARLLSSPRMVSLMRTLIAESPRFPELRERTFDFGTLPVLAALKRYLRAENDAGAADVSDPDVAAPQFLGMIATVVFWPRLVHGTRPFSEEETRRVVEEAAETMVARYGARAGL